MNKSVLLDTLKGIFYLPALGDTHHTMNLRWMLLHRVVREGLCEHWRRVGVGDTMMLGHLVLGHQRLHLLLHLVLLVLVVRGHIDRRQLVGLVRLLRGVLLDFETLQVRLDFMEAGVHPGGHEHCHSSIPMVAFHREGQSYHAFKQSRQSMQY